LLGSYLLRADQIELFFVERRRHWSGSERVGVPRHREHAFIESAEDGGELAPTPVSELGGREGHADLTLSGVDFGDADRVGLVSPRWRIRVERLSR
jgi:hypothetical protein